MSCYDEHMTQNAKKEGEPLSSGTIFLFTTVWDLRMIYCGTIMRNGDVVYVLCFQRVPS